MAVDENDPTLARFAALEARIAELEAERSPTAGDPAASDDHPVSRRRLLGMAGAAAAGAVGATVAAATPAGAAHQVEDIGIDLTNTGAATTILNSSFPSQAAFKVNNTSTTGSSGTVGIDGYIANVGGAGVLGTAEGSASQGGVGVRGIGNSGRAVGILGTSVGDGCSVIAEAPGNAPATSGAHLKLTPAPVPGPPTGNLGTTSLGSFYVDQAGALYQCVVAGSGTSAKWARQASLVTLDSPFRVYDSRASQPNPSLSTQGTLDVGGGARVINCTPTPNFTGATLPAGTAAILFNVTLANMVGSVGSVVVWANGAAEPTTSSINWSAGQATIANAVTSACDASQDVQIKCTTGVSTNVIMDVIGFYI